METTLPAGSGMDEKEFKSYYVVWKLYAPSNHFIIFDVFKSYYVVWKPEKEKIAIVDEIV